MPADPAADNPQALNLVSVLLQPGLGYYRIVTRTGQRTSPEPPAALADQDPDARPRRRARDFVAGAALRAGQCALDALEADPVSCAYDARGAVRGSRDRGRTSVDYSSRYQAAHPGRQGRTGADPWARPRRS
jgi:hypothetical protein